METIIKKNIIRIIVKKNTCSMQCVVLHHEIIVTIAHIISEKRIISTKAFYIRTSDSSNLTYHYNLERSLIGFHITISIFF